MVLRFSPDDEEGFQAATAALVRRYDEQRNDGLTCFVEQVLDFKWRYLDGDLARWTQSDVDTVLLEIYPAKTVLRPADHADVIRGFAGLLRFLAIEGFCSDEDGERLAHSVEQRAAEFELAMADADRFSAGKRLTAAMLADGVELGDQEAMDAWVAEFNARSFEERGHVLGLSDEPSTSTEARREESRRREPAVRLRPVVLAPESELIAAARNSLAVRRIEKLVSFVGAGRTLTDRGNLKVADGKALVALLDTGDPVDEQIGGHMFRTRSSADLPGVDRTFRLAVASGFLEMPTPTSVRPGTAAALLGDGLLAATRLLLEVLVGVVGTTRYRGERDRYGFGWYAEDLDDHLIGMLSLLYDEAEPLEIDALAEMFWQWLLETFDLDLLDDDRLEMQAELVNHDLRRAISRLGELGLTETFGVETHTTRYGSVRETDGTVSLTSLGTWVMQQELSEFADAPVAGLLRSVDADELLRRVADLPEDVAALELEMWVTGHSDTAPVLLVRALRDADEIGRVVGFRALTLIGPAAADEVARLGDDPELAAYAAAWHVDLGLGPVEELDASGDPERFVRQIYAVLTLWGADAVATWVVPVAGRDGVSDALEATWRVRLPETDVVLSVVGEYHPDRAVAKSARTALFRHRSSGGSTGQE